MIFILIPSFIFLDLIWWHWADLRLKPLRHARFWRVLLATFAGFNVIYVLLIIIWANPLRSSSSPIPVPIHTMVYLWHFFALPLVIPIWGLIKAVQRLRRRRSSEVGFKAAKSASVMDATSPTRVISSTVDARSHARPTRRQMIAAAAMAIPPLGTFAAAEFSVQNLYRRRTRPFTLYIPQLPRQLDGMTIAHVSDTHIGKFLHPDRLPAIADEINRLDADFIAFTGDLIDLSLDDLDYGIEFLRRLKPRCGMAICEGNHDIMQNRSEFGNRMRDAGFPTLLGDQLNLTYASRDGRSYPVQFLGVPWNFTDPEMAEAVGFIKPVLHPDAFPILLAHHPHTFDAAAAAQIPLVLSGHTHGGQVMLTPQFGIGSIRFRYTSGLYQKPGSSLIVNNGIGNWFPLRINAPAELVHITLRSLG